jgi:hypothetical protein
MPDTGICCADKAYPALYARFVSDWPMRIKLSENVEAADAII